MDDLGVLGRGVGFSRKVGACPERGSRWVGDPVPVLSLVLLLLITTRLQKATPPCLLQVVFTAPPGARHQGPGRLGEWLFQAGGHGGGQVRVVLLQLLPMTTPCPLHFQATQLQNSPQLLITRGAGAVLGGGGVQLSFDFSPNSPNCPGRWFAVAEFRGGGGACPERGSRWLEIMFLPSPRPCS